jgi:hypothetical protein
MKVGDLVRWKVMVGRKRPTTVGVVMRVFEHKLWRTEERGKKVDFASVDAEPFAEVVFNNCLRKLPQTDLEVVSEGR